VTGEALTRDALKLIDSAATTAPLREHVTLFAKQNPHSLRCALLNAPAGCGRPDLSFTVDTLPEYLHMREIAEQFPNTDFELKNLIAVADAALVGVGA